MLCERRVMVNQVCRRLRKNEANSRWRESRSEIGELGSFRTMAVMISVAAGIGFVCTAGGGGVASGGKTAKMAGRWN